MSISLIKLTSMCDVRSLLTSLYTGRKIELWTTWVSYGDDEATKALFRRRLADHEESGDVRLIDNDPHSLQALTNHLRGEDADTLVIDGIHLLTSNLMLRTNSDEETTLESSRYQIDVELRNIKALRSLGYERVILLSSTITADQSLATYQGKTYQKLLNFANDCVVNGRYNNVRSFVAMSGGLFEEPHD